MLNKDILGVIFLKLYELKFGDVLQDINNIKYDTNALLNISEFQNIPCTIALQFSNIKIPCENINKEILFSYSLSYDNEGLIKKLKSCKGYYCHYCRHHSKNSSKCDKQLYCSIKR